MNMCITNNIEYGGNDIQRKNSWRNQRKWNRSESEPKSTQKKEHAKINVVLILDGNITLSLYSYQLAYKQQNHSNCPAQGVHGVSGSQKTCIEINKKCKTRKSQHTIWGRKIGERSGDCI